MEFDKWLEKNSTKKRYAHFDARVELKDVLSEIQSPTKIIAHGFLPFIHYTLTFHKFKDGQRNDKNRELFYSSHYDRCIYQYYSFILNEAYNAFVLENGINDVAIAYRNNLSKSNIHFAKETFDFIKQTKQCAIIVGDFKNFFDRLNHRYLKKQIKIRLLINCKIIQDKVKALTLQ